MRGYRATHPDARKRERRRTALISRAKTILAKRHPEEFEEIISWLYEQEFLKNAKA